jgi:hypothetical protein
LRAIIPSSISVISELRKITHKTGTVQPDPPDAGKKHGNRYTIKNTGDRITLKNVNLSAKVIV